MRMGSNKQYAPNGNVQCTRRVVANVLNSLAGNHSNGGNGGGSLFAHFRSWQRAKRMRTGGTSASSIAPLDQSSQRQQHLQQQQQENLTPMANLCYQSMAAMFSSSKHKADSASSTTTTTTEMINYYKTTGNLVNQNGTANSSVAFHNKGDGTIAMQLSNRHLMINENQLYSMNLSGKSTSDRLTSGADEPNLSYYVMLEPPNQGETTTAGDVNDQIILSSENWYYGGISRERAIQLLRACPTGSFVVRNSATKENCFALTIRVPYDFNHMGVAHYLIVPTEEGNYRIKGFQKEFHTILSLIIHHSIMREQLPCTLRLNTACKAGENYNTSTSRMRTSKSVSRIYAINNNNNNNYGNHYMGKSCYDLTSYGAIGSESGSGSDDLMVDVDSDPTYQKVLDNFRKAMAHCN